MNKKYLQEQLYALYCAENIRITQPEDVVKKLMTLSKKDTEQFFVITLRGDHSVIKIHTITSGLVNRTLIHPREIFRPAIVDSATAIIIGHNHPSGSLDASTEDMDVTKRIKSAGEVIGISVLDHIIVSKYGYNSMMENGVF